MCLIFLCRSFIWIYDGIDLGGIFVMNVDVLEFICVCFVGMIYDRTMDYMVLKEVQNGVGIHKGVWLQEMSFHWIHLHHWIRLGFRVLARDCLIFMHLILSLFLRWNFAAFSFCLFLFGLCFGNDKCMLWLLKRSFVGNEDDVKCGSIGRN